MSEKVLGFKEKDGTKSYWLVPENVETIVIEKSKLVPVRLASESVGLKELKEYCNKEMLNCDDEYEQATFDILRELVKWAEKEAKKNG